MQVADFRTKFAWKLLSSVLLEWRIAVSWKAEVVRLQTKCKHRLLGASLLEWRYRVGIATVKQQADGMLERRRKQLSSTTFAAWMAHAREQCLERDQAEVPKPAQHIDEVFLAA